MKSIKGDLLQLAADGKFDVIVHGCNCFHTMGGGIALQIRRRWPRVADADKILSKCGDSEKLGTYNGAHIEREDGTHFYVINAYTQYEFGNGNDVAYDAIMEVFEKMKIDMGGKGLRFGVPLIGCGLAGGEWNIVEQIIDCEMEGEDVTLVEYDG